MVTLPNVPRLSLVPIEKIPGGAAFASLSRRVRTLIVAAVAFLVLFILAVTMPVPYVVLSPGPTYNTLGTDERGQSIIGIDGRKPIDRKGHLNLTTVSVSGRKVTAVDALAGWLSSDEVVVPTSSVYPPGASEQQTNEKNAQDFQQSQDSATAAALCELGYPKGFGVIDVVASGPSSKALRAGDQFVSVAGKPVDSRSALDAVLTASKPGANVPIVVKRGAKTASVSVRLGTPPAQAKKNGGYLGIVPDNTCLAPFTVDLGLGNQIGGPSAGLMFALGIMDKVGPTDLAGGRFIAGTGEIDAKGHVGAIGGIALKMIAAREKGATVFLTPAANCGDARKATPSGLRLVKVATLHGAVQDLLKIQKGESTTGC